MYIRQNIAISSVRLDLRNEDHQRLYRYLKAAPTKGQSREAVSLMLLGLEAQAAGAVPGAAGTPVHKHSEKTPAPARRVAEQWQHIPLDMPGDWSVEFGTPEEMNSVQQALMRHDKPTATLTAENEPDSGDPYAEGLPAEGICGWTCPYRARIEALERRWQSGGENLHG